MREAIAIAGLCATACVYPGQEPTGLELSWRFPEANLADGDEGIAVRTCAGAGVAEVIATVTDTDDDGRTGEFSFDCETGYQTVSEFQTTASEAYVRLQSGEYALTLQAVGRDGLAELLADEVIDVAGRQITVQPYPVALATFDWTITLASTDTCAALSLALNLDDPASAIADYPEDAGDAPTLYRMALRSDRELDLSGGQTPCTAELGGAHVVEQLDRGTYLLDVKVDDRACTVRLELDPEHPATTLDVADLPCDG